MVEQNEMLEIVTPMMEHVCDHLCRFPREISDQEELDKICGGCQMGDHLSNVLNAYDQLNDFEKSQCVHLLRELTMERAKQQWIPETERLPEPNTDVLVAVYDFGEDTSTLLDCLVESNGKPMWSTFNGATEQVLARRRLPQPYQVIRIYVIRAH